MARRDRSPRPLNAAGLERLALRYVERYATTRAKLAAYLERKLFERGQEGPVDPEALADRMAALGYVDDLTFGEAKAAAMARRGFGARRVREALRHAGVGQEHLDVLAGEIAERDRAAAIAFARRRRLGPFGPPSVDPAGRERQVAAMIRAGHAPGLAREILSMPPDEGGSGLCHWD